MIDCIVALTTWKGRIYNEELIKVLYRLLTQETKFNYKVVLSLSEEEFPKKNEELPSLLLDFTKTFENFEILWSYRNTRSLKNYYPVKRKYNDIPIIVLGDDTIYSKNLVEFMMNEHLKTPDYALGNCLFYWDAAHDEIPVLCQVRLFPSAKCMFNLSELYFVEDFKNLENDIFYGVCLKLQHTKCRGLNNRNLVVNAGFFGQENKLAFEYWKPENDSKKLYEEFVKKHPELLEIIKEG